MAIHFLHICYNEDDENILDRETYEEWLLKELNKFCEKAKQKKKVCLTVLL